MNDVHAKSTFIWSERDTRLLLLVLLLAICSLFPALGSFGILDPSDGYYSEGAREMVESGNYLTPHLNYEPFFDKPILNYWLIAACFRLFGVTEFASRLPAACCALLICVGIFPFARQFLSRRAAFIAALALVTSPMWMGLGHQSLTDMPLSCFVWISLFAFFLAIERNCRSLVWIGYLAMACGLLTKGPLAGFLIVANLAIYLLVMKRPPKEWLRLIKYLYVLPGLVLTLLLAAPWYLLENAATFGKFFQEFFLNQNINRAMGTVDHKAGPLYYFPLFFGGAFPWSIYLLTLIPLFAREPFRRLKTLWQKPSSLAATTSTDISLSNQVKLTVFATLSAVFMLCFFTALPTKLATYILPVFPALSLLAGILFDKLMHFRKNNWVKIPASLTAIVAGLATVALAFSCIGRTLNLGHSKQVLALAAAVSHTDSSLRLLLAFALAVLTAGASIAIFSNVKKGLRVQLSATVIALAIAVPTALLLAWQDKCKDFQTLVRESGAINVNAIMLGRRSPSAEFYLHHKVRFIAGEETIADDAKASPAGTYFLLNDYIVSKLPDAHVDFDKVLQRGDWQLIKTR